MTATMIHDFVLERYLQDLEKLKEEIALYRNESDIWTIKGDIKNTAGNLALHLIGNLKHFFGAVLGSTGYIRDRDKEFSDKNVSREQLLREVDEVAETLKKLLPSLSDDDMKKDYPVEFAGKVRTTLEMFLLLYGHFNYHLGQVNYHRRLIST
jgi:hypothetical protein